MPNHLPSLGRLGSTHYESKMNFQLKIVVLGAPRTGKTAIVSQFLYSHFPETYIATVDELHRAEYDIKGFGPLVLDILDTSGSHEFPAMKKLAIESADAFLLVFSLTDPKSFEEVRLLREEIIATKTSAAKVKAEAAIAASTSTAFPSASFSPGFSSSNKMVNFYHDYSYNSKGRHHSINPVINSYHTNQYFTSSTPSNEKLDHLYKPLSPRSPEAGVNINLSPVDERSGSLYDSGYIEPIKSPPIVVAGNKCDLDSMRAIKMELAETIVSIDWENGYVECSAKEDKKISYVFQQLMLQIGVPYKIGNAIGNPKIRRKSLPAYPTSPAIRDKVAPKRNSCALS